MHHVSPCFVPAELVELDSPLVGGSKKADARLTPLLANLAIKALGNDELEIGTRGAGWSLLKQLVISKPTTVESKKLYQPVRDCRVSGPAMLPSAARGAKNASMRLLCVV